MFKIILAIIIIGYIVMDMYADMHTSDENRKENDKEIWANYNNDVARINAL